MVAYGLTERGRVQPGLTLSVVHDGVRSRTTCVSVWDFAPDRTFDPATIGLVLTDLSDLAVGDVIEEGSPS